ncbi:MAG: 50S ribosome-binding GTPase [Candidatus Thorarchaeota archaeon]|nr:50S ribosome-binding GTPase [Candidatus Thorarchaeota archaeon]
MIRVALIANPNVGKSVIFNNLTGGKQHTGNWPGKTVERKEGYFEHKGRKFEIIDLPGVYSLSARSEDEKVARQYLIDYRPEVVVNVLNAAQLERNLYLTLLLVELQLNLVIVLNMWDIVEAREDMIDVEKLSERLDAPVVVTTATKKAGMKDLKDAILEAVPEDLREEPTTHDGNSKEHLPGDIDRDDHLHYHPRHHHHGEYERLSPPPVKYGTEVERKLKKIVMLIEDKRELRERFPPRWLALRLFERDEEILSMIDDPELKKKILEITP